MALPASPRMSLRYLFMQKESNQDGIIGFTDSPDMVKNTEKLRAFEIERIKAETVDIEKNFRILDALYEEARMLGVFPPKDPLEGIEEKVRLAWAIKGIKRPVRRPFKGE
jgi:hypothetical protein